MGILSDAKNLYVVNDRVAIKDYTRYCVNYWLSRGVVPMLEQVAEDIFDNDEFTLYSYSESKELVSDDQLEMISVYDFAKNVQNLVSFNMPDDEEYFYESDRVNHMKLRIRESFDNDDLSILIDKYFDADTQNLTDYHFESGLWTLDAEYRDRLVDVIRYDGDEVAVFGYCGFPGKPMFNGLYTDSIPELGYSSKDLRQKIKYLITQHGAEVI